MRWFLLISLLGSLSISAHAQDPDFRIIGKVFDESNHGVERVALPCLLHRNQVSANRARSEVEKQPLKNLQRRPWSRPPTAQSSLIILATPSWNGTRSIMPLTTSSRLIIAIISRCGNVWIRFRSERPNLRDRLKFRERVTNSISTAVSLAAGAFGPSTAAASMDSRVRGEFSFI
jgi:hypothetical protein